MESESISHYEERKGEVYKLLSRSYYLPDDQLPELVAELAKALKGSYPEAAEPIRNMSGELDIEELKIDFSKLFVGPFKVLAPPYGSVYLESGHRIMGNSTLDARNRYREAGLEFADDLKEAPDHIAIELEFMYYLIFKEVEAKTASDGELALSFLNRRKKFLVDHLGAWVSDFAHAVEENAVIHFYKDLAWITKGFVQKDMAEILRASFAELAMKDPAD